MTGFPVQRIAVIGAGISGVVSAAHLLAAKFEVTIFERNQQVGGIWLYDEQPPLECSFPSPAPSLADRVEEHADLDRETLVLQHAPPGPCYQNLTTNVSTPLMQIKLRAWPEGTPDFVNHRVVKEYIQDIATHTGVHERTVYGARVRHVHKDGETWHVNWSILDDGVKEKRQHATFDAVVVASGHYHAPHIPDIPGLSGAKERWPSRIIHSKRYRTPEVYRDANVLLIGGGVSSLDISLDIGPVANQIFQSTRNGESDPSPALLPDNATRISEIESFELLCGTDDFILSDGDPLPLLACSKSGQKLYNIHQIIVCTGYQMVFPFLPDYHNDSLRAQEADEAVLVTDGTQVHNIHRDIFYIPDPTLVFVGIPYFNTTFTLFEFQAIAVTAAFSGTAGLPTTTEMKKEYIVKLEQIGSGRRFHSLKKTEEIYVRDLLSWVNECRTAHGLPAIEGHTQLWFEALDKLWQRARAMLKDRQDRQKSGSQPLPGSN